MKFIKLKSFTFSKHNLDVTKYTSKGIWQNERSGLQVVHPVVFSRIFQTFFAHCTFARSWSHSCGRPKVFYMNITMTCAYSFR